MDKTRLNIIKCVQHRESAEKKLLGKGKEWDGPRMSLGTWSSAGGTQSAGASPRLCWALINSITEAQ